MASGKRSLSLPEALAGVRAAVNSGDVIRARRILKTYDLNVDWSEGDSESGRTILQIAAGKGDDEMVELLLDFNCGINEKLPSTGDTALMMAIDGGHEQVAWMIIQHEKCKRDIKNKAGYTALMKATKANMIIAMDQLLAYCPDLESKTTDGEEHTALSLAVVAANDVAVELLVDYGANTNNKASSGKTPVDLAWELKDTPEKRKICEILRKHKRGGDRRKANMIGQRYWRIGILGDGAQGLVVLVRDMRSHCGAYANKLRVLKRVRNRSDGRALLEEISVLKQMNHPSVLTILDYFSDDDAACIVTEHCELGDLLPWIQWADKNRLLLPSMLVTHWFLQMLLGLNYLHNQLVVHRDFKPSNIFLKSDGTIRIGDFGCSKQLRHSGDQVNTWKGTWIYMSPEVLQNESYSTECDMWSLGCTLYELCTGQSLFDPELSESLLKDRICNSQVPRLPEDLDLPDWLHDTFKALTVRSVSGDNARASAAELLRERSILRSIAAMVPDELAADREFLQENKADVLEEDYISYGPSVSDYSNAYDALLAEEQRVLESAEAAGICILPGPMADLEHLRNQLDKKRQNGFPLDEVYKFLTSGSTAALTSEQKKEKLRHITTDMETCQMVEQAIALEQECLE